MASKVLGPINKRTGLRINKNKTMDKQRLFQYAVILHNYKTDDKGVKTYVGAELIVEPTMIMAKNDKEVAFKATRQIPEDKASDPDNVEILVRPF